MTFPFYPGPIVSAAISPWSDYLELGVKRSFKANTVLLHPDETCQFLHFIARGSILVTHFASPGDSYRINIIGENAVAGIYELFGPVPPAAFWRTLDPTDCYLFSRACVENDLPRELLLNLLQQSAYAGIAMVGRFARGLNKRNDAQLARFLLHFAECCPVRRRAGDKGLTIQPVINQELSSELLGMHSVTFNKLLAAFRARGIIGRTKRSVFQILDMEALTRYAEEEEPPLL